MPLSDDDQDLLDTLAFDPAVGELVRGQTKQPLRPFGPPDGPVVGLAAQVTDGEVAEQQIKLLQPQLLPLGYRAFWTALHEPDGRRLGDAVAVLHSTDHYAILAVAQPDGGNYGLSSDDVQKHIRSWEALCRFEVVGASRDWVAIVFRSLPSDLCRFAEDVYLFCSDVFEAEMGSKARADAARRASDAQALCPELSAGFWTAHRAKFEETFDHVGGTPFAPLVGETRDFYDLLRRDTLRNVQLFSHRLAETKYLYLWWD